MRDPRRRSATLGRSHPGRRRGVGALGAWILLLWGATAHLARPAHADPRLLLRLLPGAWPEVVYFVPTSAPVVALTIDDGPDAATTPALLDVLARHDARATFFLIGSRVEGNEALVRRMVDEGHEIAHHMWRDDRSVLLRDRTLRDRFRRTAEVLEPLGPVRWFRPGSGLYNRTMKALAADRGYRICLASHFPLDTLVTSPLWVSAYVARSAQPGTVIVLHDVGARGRRTRETLERLLPELSRRGLAARTLSEVDALHDAGPTDGSEADEEVNP